VTPPDAIKAELCIEIDALFRRLGSEPSPVAITLRVEMDRKTGLPRHVDLIPEWRRVILGGAVAGRRAVS
jgi:hypothetical protein